jgi:anti-anti-sigma factor
MAKPLEKERFDSFIVFRLAGDLSSYVLNLLRTELISDVRETGICRVVLNLKDIDYITSSDLGLFVQIYHYLDAEAGDKVGHYPTEQACPEPAEGDGKVKKAVLCLTNLTPFVLDVIHMTRLDTVFKIYKTEEEAIKDLTREKD